MEELKEVTEVVIEARTGEVKKYLIPLSRHILVQENDFVKAGQTFSDGAITPKDILSIKGPTAVQEYIVTEIKKLTDYRVLRLTTSILKLLLME